MLIGGAAVEIPPLYDLVGVYHEIAENAPQPVAFRLSASDIDSDVADLTFALDSS